MEFLIVICRLGLAIFGAQLLVKGEVAIAQKFNTSNLIIEDESIWANFSD